MGAQFKEISEDIITFIKSQKIYFVGTATGSTNETSAHIQESSRMTLLFCAFEGKPLNLRLFGQAKVIHHNDSEWDELYSQFNPIPGARQIFDFEVEMVQSSCGMATPYFDYKEERTMLSDWADKQGKEGLEKYWIKKNQVSMDGIPSHIVEKNIYEK